MTLRQHMETQATLIERVLFDNNITAQVPGGVKSPSLMRYRVLLAAGQKPEAVVRLQNTLAHWLGSGVNVVQTKNELWVEVANQDRGTIRVSAIARDPHQMVTSLLGLNLHNGRLLFLHLPSPDVTHVLVAGMTGSGKTELLRGMVASLARYNSPDVLQFYLIDPMGRWFNDLAFLPHLALGSVTVDPDDAQDVIAMLADNMGQRAQSNDLSPRLVLVIDELTDLVMTTDTLPALTRLTQRGRGAGIHILAGVQKPTSEAIGSLVKGNFPVRLVGHVASPEDAKIASGLKGTGAEGLSGKGSFILCPGMIRFQAPLLDDVFLRQLFNANRRYQPTDGNQLEDYRANVKAQLNVVPGGRQIEREAQDIINAPGWVDEWWDGRALKYGAQSDIGRRLKPPVHNEGGGRRRIRQVELKILEILRSSTSSTTSTGAHKNQKGQKHEGASWS